MIPKHTVLTQDLAIAGYIAVGQHVWKKLTAQGGDLVDFVVSDKSSAYPDGGTLDGYWYDRFDGAFTFKEAFDLAELVEYDITPTANTNKLTLEMNSPDFVRIYTDETDTSTNDTYYLWELFVGNTKPFGWFPTTNRATITKAANIHRHGNTNTASNSPTINLDGNTLQITYSGYYVYLKAGVKYHIQLGK